jgi:hypothetical protein
VLTASPRDLTEAAVFVHGNPRVNHGAQNDLSVPHLGPRRPSAMVSITADTCALGWTSVSD